MASTSNEHLIPRLGTTRLGVYLVFWGLELTALVLLILILTPFFFRANPAIQSFYLSFARIAPWLLLGASVLGFVGRILCLNTPREVAPIAFLLVAVVFDALIMGWQLMSHFAPEKLMELLLQFAPRLDLVFALGIGIVVGMILATTFFVLFLRQVALKLGDAKVAKQCIGVIVLQFVIIGFVLLVVFLPISVIAMLGELAPLIIAGTLLALGLIWLARYSRTLYNMNRTLAGRQSA